MKTSRFEGATTDPRGAPFPGQSSRTTNTGHGELISQCCVCDRVRRRGRWRRAPHLLHARYSHGYCPDCFREAMAKLREETFPPCDRPRRLVYIPGPCVPPLKPFWPAQNADDLALNQNVFEWIAYRGIA